MVPLVIPGLSIDDEGRFLVHGEPVTHERTLEVLWRGLEPADGGGWIVRVGRDGLLRATLASGHPARFCRAAQIALGMRLSEDATAPGGFQLSLGTRSWPLGAE